MDPGTDQVHSLHEIHEAMKLAVDSNNPALRTLQDHVISSGHVRILMEDARSYNVLAFELMQLLCYRNKPAVQLLVEQGLVLLIERVLLDSGASRQVQLAALFVLSAVSAFSMDIHSTVLATKIISILVDICRDFGLQDDESDAESSGLTPVLQPMNCTGDAAATSTGESAATSTARAGVTRISCAVATLRNFCHIEAHHDQLVAAGVADVCCHIMHLSAMSRTRLSHSGAGDCPPDSATSHVHLSHLQSIYEGGGDNTFTEFTRAFAASASAPASVDTRSRGTANSSRRSSMDSLQSWQVVPFTEQFHCVRINAAMAVAILVGHDEENPLLEMDVGLTHMMLDVLDHACRGELRFGLHWTVWKLSQAFANLAVCDKNKVLILEHGGVEVLGRCLQTKHAHMAAVQRYSIMSFWHLAFLDLGRELLRARLDIIEAVKALAVGSKDAATRDVSNGCLWTLGVTHDMKARHRYIHNAPLRSSSNALEDPSDWLGKVMTQIPEERLQHLMISYCWDSQQKALLLKQELVKLGYRVWMDVEKMSGSTLEAMALAVEESAAVLVCYSRKYKESQACRTEAEYSFQMRKRIVPILLEADYRPTGWLGALLGTKLYFDCSDRANIPLQVLLLERELGNIARCSAGKAAPIRSSHSSVVDKVQRPVRGLHGSHSAQQLPHVAPPLATASCTESGSKPKVPVASSEANEEPLLHGTSHHHVAEEAPVLEQQPVSMWSQDLGGVEGQSNTWMGNNVSSSEHGQQLVGDVYGDMLHQAPNLNGHLPSSAQSDVQPAATQQVDSDAGAPSAHLEQTCCSSSCSDGDDLPEDRCHTASVLSHRLAPVERWTQEQVADWLINAARLPGLVSAFQVGKIDGRGLCGLMRLSGSGCLRACLKEDLGIKRVGMMLAFIEELHKLFD